MFEKYNLHKTYAFVCPFHVIIKKTGINIMLRRYELPDSEWNHVVELLPPETVVMHDHNIVNYCSDYSFTNIECNAHLLRDLHKVYDHMRHT